MASAQSKVELIVDASKAVNPLRKTEQATRKLEGAVRDANGRLRDAKGRFIGMGAGAQKAKKGVDSLTGAFGKLAAAISVIGVGKFVFFKTAELQTQTRSLKVLTGSLETAKNIIAELQQFGNVTPFTSAELIETAKRLKAFGFETEKIVDVTKRLSDIAGATGADLGGIATAFGQIQAKGRLQGEELLQLQERGVDLQGTLRQAYGLTAEEFQKALSAGRIGADAVNYALEKLTDTGGKYAEGAFAQSDTLSGKLSTLQDNVDNLARVFGETMAPALALIIDDITKMVNTFVRGLQFMQTSYNDFMKSLRSTTISDLQKDIQGANDRIANLQTQLSKVDERAPGGVGAAKGLRDRISEIRALRKTFEADVARLQGTDLFMPKGTFTAPGADDGAAPPVLGSGTQPKGKGAEDRLAKLNKSLSDYLFNAKNRLTIETQQEQLDKIRAEADVARLEVQRKYADLTKGVTDATALKNAAEAESLELRLVDMQLTKELSDALDDQSEKLKRQTQQFGNAAIAAQQFAAVKNPIDNLGDSLSQTTSEITTLVSEVARGTTTMGDAFKRFADSIINQMIRIAAQQAVMGLIGFVSSFFSPFSSVSKGLSGKGALATSGSGLGVGTSSFSGNLTGATAGSPLTGMGSISGLGNFSGFQGAFANGGSVIGGRAALVGERGPELFVPGRSGSIIPNNAMGGNNIVVNVDATGSNVQGNGNQAKALGSAIGAAVRAELINQQRPGGLLA